jgi:hypothetical protein
MCCIANLACLSYPIVKTTGLGPVPLSPLQKRIRDLSARIVSTQDVDEFHEAASELKAALREHAESLRKVVDETRKRLSKAAQGDAQQ